jgi:hypothetical protein
MMAIDVLTSMAFWVWVSIWVTMLYVCGSCQFRNGIKCYALRADIEYDFHESVHQET